MGSLHQPVLVDEVLAWLMPREGLNSIIVDGTVGGGGHAVALARRLGAGGRVIGLDRDSAMLDLAEAAVAAAGSPLLVTLIHAAYRDMRRVLDQGPESGSHQRLVVGDQHPDRHEPPSAGSGSRALTLNPPSGRGPAVRLPPAAATRSRIPVMPWPELMANGGLAGPRPAPAARVPAPGSVISTDRSWGP